MNFQQLRSLRETVRQGYNLTTVAEALHTSQPGVSRQLRDLEDELGVARYALPVSVRDFCAAHPNVTLHLQQGSPRQIAPQVLAGEVDLGIATVSLERLAQFPLLSSAATWWTPRWPPGRTRSRPEARQACRRASTELSAPWPPG